MFREMFFEEADELLSSLEAGIAALDRDKPARAQMDQVYRAAHSLKGAALMVGFQTISDQALEMERAFSQVRSGAAAWSLELAASLAAQRGRLASLVQDEASRSRESSA
jgi:two-component system chemotaxis sensor kinase CheA